MNICFVTPEFVTEELFFDGGIANYLFRVSLGLIELGHNPIIVVRSDRDEIISYRNIKVHRVNVKQLQGSYSINCLYQSYILNNYLEKLAHFQKIDIVQYASFMGVGIYRVEFIPAVVRLSSYNPLITKYFEIPDSKDNRDLNFIENTAIINADAVYGPCKLIASEISNNERININVIESPFVYDVAELDYSLSSQLSGKKYLLFFGTLGLLKGITTIAEILSDLFSKYDNLYFVFIGKDVGYNGNKMMDYVYKNASHYRDRIFYYGKMKHEQLYPFIKNAYAVVLPSRIDNFPNTGIEAMAHNKIVIGTKNTGFDQLIEDGINGYLFEKDNARELLLTVEKVLSLSEVDIHRIQSNAGNRIDLLKPQNAVKKLVDFFTDVINKKKNNSSVSYKTIDMMNSFLWDKIMDIDNRIAENLNTIHYQNTNINSIYNSASYKIGNIILNPFSYIKRFLKCLK